MPRRARPATSSWTTSSPTWISARSSPTRPRPWRSGWNAFKWPGHGLGDDNMYQYVDGEYMKAEEYDEFICDPSDFMLRKWAPRQFKALAGLRADRALAPLHVVGLDEPRLLLVHARDAGDAAHWSPQAGEETEQVVGLAGQYWGEIKDKGYPAGLRRLGLAAVRHPGRHAARHAPDPGRHAPPPGQAARRAGSGDQDLHRVRLRRRRRAAARLPGSGSTSPRASSCPMRSSRSSTGRICARASWRWWKRASSPSIYWEADWRAGWSTSWTCPHGKIIYHLSNTNFEKA